MAPRSNPGAIPETVAVCVCSVGRESLSGCLRALTGQQADSIAVWVVLIDNTAAGELPERLARDALAESVTVVHESRPGIPAARNAALAEALRIGADHVAFVDDDEIAPPGWLAELHATMRRSEADVMQGALRRVGTVEEALAQAASWRSGGEARVRRRKTAATNNVMFRSWLAADPISLRFDEALTRMGGSDGEFFMRAADAGARIFRTSGAPVFEVWTEKRETLAFSCRRAWRVGAAANYRYRKNRKPAVAAGVLLARAAWRATVGATQVLASALPVRDRHARFAKGAAALSFAAGCLTPYTGIRPDTYY